MSTKLDKVSDDDFRKIVEESKSYAEVIRKIGYSNGGSASRLIKSRMNELGILFGHFKNQVVYLKCVRCNEEKVQSSFYKHSGNTGRNGRQSYCKDCNHLIRDERRSKDNGFIKTMILSCKYMGIRRSKKGRENCDDYNLTLEFILELKDKQNNRCALSGIEMIWESNSGWKKASIDRLDNDKGYTKDNVRLVAWGINQAMSNYSDDIFLEMCRAVVKNNDTPE